MQTCPKTSVQYCSAFLSPNDAHNLYKFASGLDNYKRESGTQTCKSTKKVEKLEFALQRVLEDGGSHTTVQAHYYWGQHLSDSLFAETNLPKAILDLRQLIITSLKLPETITLCHKPNSIAHSQVGDSVPILNSITINRYDGVDDVVTPHHDGQAGDPGTPGAQKALVDGTSIFSVTVCDPGAERRIELHEVVKTKAEKIPVYSQVLENGSLFELNAEANRTYKHSIPAPEKRKREAGGVRYAFLFRTAMEVTVEKLQQRKMEGDKKVAEKAKTK
ncbi:hypothetical protein ScalyP_jg9184 [Parmales sp. scaly parma]|nr:hypothetical protein ScalyP_jg9184 [Parmales sp. scaly parma]